jgi:hypothetical protein
VAETARKKSAELRRQAEPTKQKRMEKQQAESGDRAALENRFGPGGTLSTGLDQYGRYVLQEMVDPATGQTAIRYLFIEPGGRNFEVLNGTDIIKKVKSVYKDQEALRRALYEKGDISERDYLNKSTSALNGAILSAATEFSTEVADAYTTEGKIQFPTFDSWISERRGGGGGEDRGPRRDIQKYDRDVIRQMVVDAYLDSPNANLPSEDIIERDTDKYMKQIEKGTLTKSKKNKAGETEVVSSPGFSEQRLKDEIRASRKIEFAEDEKKRVDLNFLSFIAGME